MAQSSEGINNVYEFVRLRKRDELEREGRRDLDLWQEDESDREVLSASVMVEIARSHASEESYANKVIEIAESLAEKNPIDLLVELAGWVAGDLNDLAARARHAGAIGSSGEMQRLVRELGFRRSKAEGFLQRLFRLDPSLPAFPGILDLPTVSQLLAGQTVELRTDEARRRLNLRVLGQKVVDIVEVCDNPPQAAVGTDASVGDIRIEHKSGSFIRPTDAALFVSAGAMRVTKPDIRLNYWDYDFDPRELARYRDLDAAVEGLLISPHLRREVITDFRHLRSAAMELRQYKEELRVLNGQSRWHPVGGVPELSSPPEVTLLIRDGRLFPLVHRLEDYEGASAPDDVLYGQIVRREIKAFRNIFNATAGTPFGPVYAGTVKSPEYSWLAMLTFWYMYRAGCAPSEGFYRPPLNDQAVAHLLFLGIAKERPDLISNGNRHAFVTFRVVRRFSDIALSPHPRAVLNKHGAVQKTVDENNPEDWKEYIFQHIEEAARAYELHRRAVPALDPPEEYGPFLDLCCRAGVAMFYAAPTRLYRATLRESAHFLMPRWELAVDVTGNVEREANRRLDVLLGWLLQEGGLVRDEDHTMGSFAERVPGVPLWVPDVVSVAHQVVGYGRDRHVGDLTERLNWLINEIRSGRVPAMQT
ncbi:MAG TPA: hypothetical protein GX507_11570 [Clostridia bacterium]|nr:hypothetical protein [Clostridia bacterium]